MSKINLISVDVSKPSVKAGESQDDYVSRCIPYVMKNEGLDQKQASGKCFGMYRGHTQKRIDLGLGDFGENEDAQNFEIVGKFLSHESYIASDACTMGGVSFEKGQELRIATGIVLEPETVDGQGDIFSEEEVRKTAHAFLSNYYGQGNGWMHQSYGSTDMKIVESYIAPVDMVINEQQVKKGTWLMSTLFLDESIWKGVKEGKYNGYSIRGKSNARLEG